MATATKETIALQLEIEDESTGALADNRVVAGPSPARTTKTLCRSIVNDQQRLDYLF